jgi:hypothetical protein
VADRVLPALLVALEVREMGRDVRVDLGQCCPLVGAVLYRHGYEGHVRIWRFRFRVWRRVRRRRRRRAGGTGALGDGHGRDSTAPIAAPARTQTLGL